jgi:hypothetical protein
MPDNDPVSDSTHLRDRLGVPANGVYGVEPSRAERITASQITDLCAAGDMGSVRRMLHDLEHGLTSWSVDVDPWRLLEALAERIRQPEAAPVAVSIEGTAPCP